MSALVTLVGPPGAGKTSVATAVADALGVTVRDTDEDIVRQSGSSIQDIFVEHGESHFRELEQAAVASAVAGHDGVLALGGGAVISPDTRRLLADHFVVFLNVSLAAAASRVGLNSGRPLLLGNVRSTLKKLMDERQHWYIEVADLVIDTTDLTVHEVSNQIVEELNERLS